MGMNEFDASMLDARIECSDKARRRAAQNFHVLCVSSPAVGMLRDWKQWRCVHVSSKAVESAVAKAVKDAPETLGADADMCFAIADTLARMASLGAEKTTDKAAETLDLAFARRAQLKRVADGDVPAACERIAATHGYAYTPALKRMAAALVAHGPQTLAAMAESISEFATTHQRASKACDDLVAERGE